MTREGSHPEAPRILAAGLAGQLFAAVLALWMVLPLAWHGTLAQDALPLHVASRVALEDPAAVYVPGDGGTIKVSDAFAAEGCPYFPDTKTCDVLLVGFVSPPMSLPALLPLGLLPVDFGLLVVRLLGAAALVAGMVLLWRRVAGLAEWAPAAVLVTTLALTPLATASINLGQTSPLLFLSGMLGVGVADRLHLGRALLWAATVTLKLFPAVLGLLLLQRRRKMLGVAAAALAVLAVSTVPLGMAEAWPSFLRVTFTLTDDPALNPYLGSLEAVLYQTTGIITGPRSPAMVLVRIVLAVLIVALVMRLRTDDERWAVGFVGAVLLMPQAWWHYSWTSVAALAIVIGARREPRALALLPAYAIVALPASVASTRGWSISPLQLALPVAVLCVIGWLSIRPSEAMMVEEVP